MLALRADRWSGFNNDIHRGLLHQGRRCTTKCWVADRRIYQFGPQRSSGAFRATKHHEGQLAMSVRTEDSFLSLKLVSLLQQNAQRRLLDIANTLGLSTSVLRFIERRGQQDKWILYGGMAVTVVILILLLIYVA